MSTPESLTALADRVEREEPSRELDAAVLIACGHQTVYRGQRMGWEYRPNGVGIWRSMPSPTTSLDSAVTLVPDFGSWLLAKGRLTPDEPLWGAGVYLDEAGDHEIGHAETNSSAAACLCAAALRARAALKGGE